MHVLVSKLQVEEFFPVWQDDCRYLLVLVPVQCMWMPLLWAVDVDAPTVGSGCGCPYCGRWLAYLRLPTPGHHHPQPLWDFPIQSQSLPPRPRPRFRASSSSSSTGIPIPIPVDALHQQSHSWLARVYIVRTPSCWRCCFSPTPTLHFFLASGRFAVATHLCHHPSRSSPLQPP